MEESKTKTEADDAAFPKHPNSYFDSSLTKREYFAAMAMQGLLANSLYVGDVAISAVGVADALIEALNK